MLRCDGTEVSSGHAGFLRVAFTGVPHGKKGDGKERCNESLEDAVEQEHGQGIEIGSGECADPAKVSQRDDFAQGGQGGVEDTSRRADERSLQVCGRKRAVSEAGFQGEEEVFCSRGRQVRRSARVSVSPAPGEDEDKA